MGRGELPSTNPPSASDKPPAWIARTLGVVVDGMVAARHYLKVLPPIVAAISIPVVHYLVDA
jgi:hypothetical protein